MNLFIGVISFLIINIWCSQILKIGFALEGEILKEASGYIKIFSISILLNLMIFTYSTIFKIFRETKHIFSTTIIVNLINIALDYILIFKVNLGSRGAAIATIIALFINVIIYIYKSKNLVKINFSIKNVVKRIKHILNFSMPFMGQEFMEDIVFIIGVNAIIARVGVLELSTYTLITQIINIVLMPMFGYTTANLSLVSENFTKNNIEKCEYISKYTSIILIFIHLIMFVIIFLFKDYIPKLITSDTALCNFSTKFLPIAIFIQILNYIMSVYKSSIQAINCQKWTLKVTFFINICTLVLIFLWGKNLYNVYICIGISYLLNFALFKSKYRKLLNGQYSVLDKY
jgi:putative MATE family efflux protein